MCRPHPLAVIIALGCAASGCGIRYDPGNAQNSGGGSGATNLPAGTTDPDAGPYGPVQTSPLLAPFAGNWTMDWEQTLAARTAAGASPEAIEQMQRLHDVTQLTALGSQLAITGDVAIGDPFPFSEYRLFSMHQHGEKVCGKAWHHEDRFDPGDVSKCYVRLQLVDGKLHLETRMLDGYPALNDPDVLSQPPVAGGAVDACEADTPAPVPGIGNEMNAWSDWLVTVYTRQR